MYNLPLLTACLAPLLGFRQSPDGSADEPQLDASLLAAAGGVAMQQVHPLLTLRSILQVAPEDAKPSAYLLDLRQAAVAKALAAFTARKKLAGAGKTVLADTPLTGQSGAYRRKVIKQGRFVGLALRIVAGRDILVRIAGLGTQFTDPNPNFRLYLYHSSDPTAPVATYDVAREKRVYFEWTPLAIELPLGPTGGEYWLGYFEDDLVGQAVDLDQNFSERPCQGCGNDYLNFDKWAPLVQVRAFTAPATAGTDELPVEKVTYVTASNFGLNLQLSAVCDLTDYFCRQRGLFLETLQLQFAVDLLSTMAYSTRNNGVKSDVQALALLELNNRPDYQPGLLSKLEKALGALDVDLSGVSKPCLPCTTAKGVTVGVV